MDSPEAAGSLEELAATDPLPEPGEPALDGDSRPGAGAADVALMKRAKPDEVSFAQQVGVFIGMVVFGLGVLLPAAVLLWGAVAIGVSALAGAALLHTGGLEPRSFGPAMLVGLSLAAVLLIFGLPGSGHGVRHSAAVGSGGTAKRSDWPSWAWFQ